MNIQELRQSLKLKWLNYYHKNHSWLIKMRVWSIYDGERRPLSSFILATLSVLEPQLEQLFPFILELSNNPDQIISALGLNFNPEKQLHLVNSHHTTDTDRTHERSLWEDLVYEQQPENGHMSHAEMADEQAMVQNNHLMTMLVDEETVDQSPPSLMVGEQVDKPLPAFVIEETAETLLQPVAVLENQDNTAVKSGVEELTTPISLPTRMSQAVATVSEDSISTADEPPGDKVTKPLPLHTFVLDEITGIFHQSEPTFSDVQQPSHVESSTYTLGETICIPSLATENQSVEFSKLEHQPEPGNNQEDVSSRKKKRFNLASWIDDFCQGTGWDREDTIFIPF